MKEAARDTILATAPKAKNPWIGEHTLSLIEDRSRAGEEGMHARAAQIDREARKPAKADRKKWFGEKLTGKVWDP
eukprot:13842988-Alexandrium_andersonii.AAC.1